MTKGPVKRIRLFRLAGRLVQWILLACALLYGGAIFGLVALRWVNPPVTAVQIERGLTSRTSYKFVPLARISPHLVQAVIAAEDARFYTHHGFDWKEIRIAVDSDPQEGPRRGASTITQQLVKNLFLSTGRSWVRKGIEFTLVPPSEWILGKTRILELYLNVVEWGPDVYGAEAAAQAWYREPAARITREQAIQLAALLPAPLHRRPGRTGSYRDKISERMREAGW